MTPLPLADTTANPLPWDRRYGVPDPVDYGAADSRFRNVEIEINTACDLSCFGCDRMSDVTTAPNMTVGQVRRFVRESVELDWLWERIRLLGREPTLHPHFEVIVGLLLAYRSKHNPSVFLQVLTNGHGKASKHRGWLERDGISLHAEAKEPGVNPPWFRNTRVVPVDREPGVGALPPCSIFGVRGCGVRLTRNGFFLDGAGASAARVAGYDVGVQSLAGVTWDAMLTQARVLCRICGHWNPTDGPGVVKLVTETGKVTGPFWAERIAAYNGKRVPQLTLYGED